MLPNEEKVARWLVEHEKPIKWLNDRSVIIEKLGLASLRDSEDQTGYGCNFTVSFGKSGKNREERIPR